MSKPVLSLDVSKESSYAATYLSMYEPSKKPVSVPHNPHQVILESTGNYSKPITHCLHETGYSVIVLNPIQTHLQKRRSIRKVKTDPVDA